MKSLLMFILLILLSATAICRNKIDSALRKKILVMFKEDQKWRIEINKLQNDKTSLYDEATIENNMGKADSLNMLQAKKIVKAYGFPGYSLVGEDGSDAFWSVVQHSDDDIIFQQQILSLMQKEVKNNNASGEKLALLQDRVLVNQGHKQIYGTQVRLNPKTREARPFPIQDSVNVDSRRRAVGLSPLSEYLKLFEKH